MVAVISSFFAKASEEVGVDITTSESCDITGETINSNKPAHCYDTDAGWIQLPENPHKACDFSKNYSDTGKYAGQDGETRSPGDS